MGGNAKKKKWVRFRHQVVRHVLFLPIYLMTVLKYHVKVSPLNGFHKRQCLILFNHQTEFDQFFVSFAFRKHVYYLSSEDIMSNGFISSCLKFLVAPIPIKKNTTDLGAIKNCLQVAKEGGTIAMAPEGNRTFCGRTVNMRSTVAGLARKIKLPIVLFRIEDGYGVQPRWSDVVRKGKMRAYVSKVIEPSEYNEMTDEELFAVIKEGLYVDEACESGNFYHKKSAEYLDRVMYVCPDCGFSAFLSKNDLIKCTTCGKEIQYLPNKQLKGVGFDFPFKYVGNWYDYQCDLVNKINPDEFVTKPLFTDEVCIYKVILSKNKKLLEKGVKLELYSDRMVLFRDSGEDVRYFDKVTAVTVVGRNKINVYDAGSIIQLRGNKHFNALKYVNMFNRCFNVKKGDENDKFLGL